MYGYKEAALAHDRIEKRKTIGKVLLIPTAL